jgi:hypothetical protein
MDFRAQLEAVWCSPAKKQAMPRATVSLGCDEADPLAPEEKTPSKVKKTTRNELRKNGKRSCQSNINYQVPPDIVRH